MGWDVRSKRDLFKVRSAIDLFASVRVSGRANAALIVYSSLSLASQWRATEALNCCLVVGDDVWAGGQEGTIYRWDLRTQSLVETIQR
jgi:hypothetical protein